MHIPNADGDCPATQDGGPAPEPPADGAAETAPDPRDRRTGDRRSGTDRRAGTTPPAGVERRQGDRRGPDRRAQPATAPLYRDGERRMNDYPLTPEETEFINAINVYRQSHGRPFPTWSEVLHVLRFLGYEKRSAPSAADAPSDPA